MNTIDASKIKLIAMDLDGTLTQHKQPMSPRCRETLVALGQKYKLIMVGAGQVMRIFNQMEHFPIDIIGNYGLQYGVYNPETKDLDILRNETLPLGDKAVIEQRVTMLREKHGYTTFAGDNVEYHPSGCLTFPVLGTKAVQADKLAFDPDRAKRRKIYAEVCEAFDDYCVFVGGSSSFDIVPGQYGKLNALRRYMREQNLTNDQVVYCGDDYREGGNDHDVYAGGIPFVKVDDYENLGALLEEAGIL